MQSCVSAELPVSADWGVWLCLECWGSLVPQIKGVKHWD